MDINTDRIKNEMHRLLDQLGKDHQITIVIRNTKDSKDCKIVTTEGKITNVIDTIAYLSTKYRERKAKLS